MAMSRTTLASELLNLVPVATEVEAAQTFTDAYATFAAGATAGPSTITPTGIALGKAAMAAALVGMSAPGAGASSITSGVQAFWSAVASGLATSFAGALAIVPPPHAGLNSALGDAFDANTSSAATKEAATSRIADALYTQAVAGGTVTYFGPVVVPII